MFPYLKLHPFYNAEGSGTNASGLDSHAEGYNTSATADAAHAEGNSTLASGSASHAEGYSTQATIDTAHAEGNSTVAAGPASHAEGFQSLASANTAHAEGSNTNASGIASHAEGQSNVASGVAAHAEGEGNLASGEGSHAEGGLTKATAQYAHAEGFITLASGLSSHAEGSITVAEGANAHAEGSQNVASGNDSHAQNFSTRAEGFASHSQGTLTLASGNYSHAEGNGTTAEDVGAHIMGFNGISLHPYSWHLAYGTELGPALSAIIEAATGNIYIDGTVITPAADYAEMFETVDGQPLEPGIFVTTAGEKIRAAQPTDSYILGVVSAKPSMIGDGGELRWQGKYKVDEWGRELYEDAVIPGSVDKNGNIIAPEHTVKRAIINPSYDPAREYVSRRQRPEWVAVGIVGKLLVRDDGTCVPDGYCRPSTGGIATAAPDGYRVLARTGPNQIKIMMK